MLRLLLLSLGLIVVTSCPKPSPTMPPKQPTPAPDDIGKLAPPPVTRRPKFGDAVHLDLGGRTGGGVGGAGVGVGGVPSAALQVRSKRRASMMPEPITPDDDEALRRARRAPMLGSDVRHGRGRTARRARRRVAGLRPWPPARDDGKSR